MTNKIKETFYKEIPLSINPALCKAITKYVNAYEVRRNNAAAFNTPILGVDLGTFTTADRDNFFQLVDGDFDVIYKAIESHIRTGEVFGVSTRELDKQTIKDVERLKKEAILQGVSMSDIRKSIGGISSINTSYKVASDPFNIFITYLIHCIYNCNTSENIRIEACKSSLMLLQYKFFTSMVNHRFKYKADEGMMSAYFENLSFKNAIKRYGTWRNLLSARADELLSDKSIHLDTIKNYAPDSSVLYLITDVQSRLRQQLNIFTEGYFNFKKTEDAYGNYSNIGSDADGEKIIQGNTECLDTVISAVYNDVQSVTRFLDDKNIKICTGLFSTISAMQFRSLLIKFSDYISTKTRHNELDDIKKYQGNEVYVGSRILIEKVIENTIRYCKLNNVNMSRPTDILKATKDVFSASRVSDEGICKVRNSVDKFVLESKISSRTSTNASLRIALIIYLIIDAFKYMH